MLPLPSQFRLLIQGKVQKLICSFFHFPILSIVESDYWRQKGLMHSLLLNKYSGNRRDALSLASFIMLLKAIGVFFFLIFIFLLYNTVLVLPYIDMNPPQVYISSQPWNSLPPPTPYHLSGSSQSLLTFKLGCLSLCCWTMRVPYIFWIRKHQICDLQTFSPGLYGVFSHSR